MCVYTEHRVQEVNTMKIRRSDLERIIREEICGVLDEVNPTIEVRAQEADSSPLKRMQKYTV